MTPETPVARPHPCLPRHWHVVWWARQALLLVKDAQKWASVVGDLDGAKVGAAVVGAPVVGATVASARPANASNTTNMAATKSLKDMVNVEVCEV